MFLDRKISLARGIACVVALGVLVMTFARASEASASDPRFDVVSLVGGKSGRIVEAASCNQPALVFLGVMADVQPFVPSSFLLFDFKQNLRHWPVLAGDISRSPPLFAAL
jgi:hypothetical protein